MGLKEGVVWAAQGGRNMEKKRFERVFFLCSGLVLAAITVSACSGDGGTSPARDGTGGLTALCKEIQNGLLSAVPKDAIQSLTNPDLVGPDSPFIDFLLPTDRVIGVEINGEYLAVPHNILWWHEIANFDAYGLAVTYCPLTGSSMVFHREGAEGAAFGVSGLLFKNNLVMYDRVPEGEDSLWPQMLAGGFCGVSEGKQLAMYPSIEIEWEDWLALHPDTRVVSDRTGQSGLYERIKYPYGRYEDEDNALTVYPLEDLDGRRPPKERVLAMFSRSGRGVVFPFGALRDAAVGDLAVVHTDLGGEQGQSGVDPVVVFWDSGAVAAVAFRPSTGTRDLTFEVRDGAFVDVETGSQWSIEGTAISGPLQGDRLVPIVRAYVVFWFAFTQLFPNPVLWLS